MHIRSSLTLLAVLTSATAALSQNLDVLLDPEYPTELYVPFRDGDRWGFSDTLGRLVVAAQFDSVGGFGLRYEKSQPYRTVYHDGGWGLISGAPAQYAAGPYDVRLETTRLRDTAYAPPTYAHVLHGEGGYDVVGAYGSLLVEGAHRIRSAEGVPYALAVLDEEGRGWRLIGWRGEDLSPTRFDELTALDEPPGIPLQVSGGYDNGGSFTFLVDSTAAAGARVYYCFSKYVAYIYREAEPERADTLFLPDLDGRRALARGALTADEMAERNLPPPPPPSPPSSPGPHDYGDNIITNLYNRIVGIVDTTVTVEADPTEAEGILAGYPDLGAYYEVQRNNYPLPPPPPAPPSMSDEEFRTERLALRQRDSSRRARHRQAAAIISRSLAAYSLDSATRVRSALDRLGLETLGTPLGYTRYRPNRTIARFRLVQAASGEARVLDVVSLELFDPQLDTVGTMISPRTDYSASSPADTSLYFFLGAVNGRAAVHNERGRPVLTGDFDRLEYESRTGLVRTYRKDKTGLWLLNTSYPPISPIYDTIQSGEYLPVSPTWAFRLFDVVKDGRTGQVGENGVEFFR